MNSRRHLDSLRERRTEVDKITAHAAKVGLSVTADMVSDKLEWFRRWYMGLISTGQLMNRTGVKYKPRVIVKRKVGRMTDGTTFMYDTVGTDASHILASSEYVAGYVSGTNGIEWSPENWARFTSARKVRIYQGNGPAPAPHQYDALDVENGAVTPERAAQYIRERVQAGVTWTTVYGTDSTLAAVSAAVRALGETIWNGHVNCWLADWNLDHAGSIAKIGTYIHGMTCVGVQWASPTSNPNTMLPGTTMTLKQANVDISTVDNTWVPSGGWGTPPAPPKTPAPPELHGVVVRLDDGIARAVISTDSGKTWH